MAQANWIIKILHDVSLWSVERRRFCSDQAISRSVTLIRNLLCSWPISRPLVS